MSLSLQLCCMRVFLTKKHPLGFSQAPRLYGVPFCLQNTCLWWKLDLCPHPLHSLSILTLTPECGQESCGEHQPWAQPWAQPCPTLGWIFQGPPQSLHKGVNGQVCPVPHPSYASFHQGVSQEALCTEWPCPLLGHGWSAPSDTLARPIQPQPLWVWSGAQIYQSAPVGISRPVGDHFDCEPRETRSGNNLVCHSSGLRYHFPPCWGKVSN